MRTIDVVGQQFGRLTVREILTGSQCVCDCTCGITGFVTESYSVRKGLTKSCGCLKAEKMASGSCNLSHGDSKRGGWAPEYRAWVNMITRCHNPNATRYKDWGGRGIGVCNEWRESYVAFLAYVGRRPSPRHSLDRYPNVNGNYEPGNVRWATRIEQARNKRRRNHV